MLVIALSAIVLLGILIFVHELGHFLVAKLMGVRVERFSLGFGPKVAGRTIGETEYVVSALPLGGYVKMFGESASALEGGGGEARTGEEDMGRSFSAKPVWRRFMIVSAGPLSNIAFAALLFVLIFLGGVPALLPEVGEVLEGSPAMRAGIRPGDRIVGIDGTEIDDWSAMTGIIHGSPGNGLDIVISRDGVEFEVQAAPEANVVKNIFGEDEEIGLIGIKPSGATFTRELAPSEAVRTGLRRTVEISVLTVVSIVKLVQRAIPAHNIGGPIMILQMAGQQASEGAMNFFSFMAVISINLGIINLFPIPVLDGGHIVFLGIEALRRKPLSEKAMIAAQKVGLALILALIAFATYNDVLRWFTGKGMP